MIHYYQRVNFRNWVFPFTSAKASALFKSQFRTIKTGDLYRFLTELLAQSQGFSSLGAPFTLINIYSKHTKFSRGCSLPPDEKVFPGNQHLLFTFALSLYDSVSQIPISVINKRSNSVVQFGSPKAQGAFLTIGLSQNECTKFGLSSLHTARLNYLYNVLGPLTKTFSRYPVRPTDYDDLSLVRLQSVVNKPLSSVLKAPPPYWAFSKEVWEYAPNILTEQHITSKSVLNYFINIIKPNSSSLLPSSILGMPPKKGDSSVLGMLASSLVLLVQNLNAGVTNGSRMSELELIAPAVLYPFITTSELRSKRLPITQQVDSLLFEFFGKHEELAKILMPPERAAIRVYRQDPALRNELLNLLNTSIAGTSSSIESEAKQ